nr:Abi-alpha family protein [Gordonia humi]
MGVDTPRSLLEGAVAATRTALNVAAWSEEQLLALANAGLDSLVGSDAADDRLGDDHRQIADGEPDEKTVAPARPVQPSARHVSATMHRLLEQAVNQRSDESRLELLSHIVDQLVADEARIIGALSDGSSSPLIKVVAWRRGGSRSVALENVSLVGRTANLGLPAMVPAYVSHLLSLGLIDIGPEDPELKTDYEILAAETSVMDAVKRASLGPVGPKIEKRSLTLSPLGHELWSTAMRDEA